MTWSPRDLEELLRASFTRDYQRASDEFAGHLRERQVEAARRGMPIPTGQSLLPTERATAARTAFPALVDTIKSLLLAGKIPPSDEALQVVLELVRKLGEEIPADTDEPRRASQRAAADLRILFATQALPQAAAAGRPKRTKTPTSFGPWRKTGEQLGGSSGQGDVYVARRQDGGPEYALKVLRNRNRVARFAREVKAIQALDHPYIVKIVDYDLSSSRPFLVLPIYRRGHLTVDLLRTLTPTQKMRLFLSICEAIAHAHERGVIHRDIKPSNVLLDDAGSPKVVDCERR